MVQVEGKLLCWLCTMSYKRVIEKARKRDGIPLSTSYTGSGDESGGRDRANRRKQKKHRSTDSHRRNGSRDRHRDRVRDKAADTLG